MVVVGSLAILHGYAHSLEAPEGDPGRYILGFLAATALLQGVGLGFGWVAQRLGGGAAGRRWSHELGRRRLGPDHELGSRQSIHR